MFTRAATHKLPMMTLLSKNKNENLIDKEKNAVEKRESSLGKIFFYKRPIHSTRKISKNSPLPH